MRLVWWVARAATLWGIFVLCPLPAGGVDYQEGPAQSSDPPPPSGLSERVAEEMLRLARVGADDVVYDFGSTGTVAIAAAHRFGARGVGIGLEPADAERGRQAARAYGVTERVRFVEGDLPGAAFAEATVVTLDLSPDVNAKLQPILRRELRPGTRVVSHRYGIGAWRAEATARASDGAMLFLWTVPRPPARTPDIFFVATPQTIVEAMLELAGVTAKDVVYDLGSGDGRMVVIAAQNYGARGVGVEIDPALVEISRQVARDAQVDGKVRFIEADLFAVDLSEATVVTLFLSPSINRRLETKLRQELRDGARIVSRQFDIGGWVPDRTVIAEDGQKLYLWTIRKR
jgi:predicted RNA methylase